MIERENPQEYTSEGALFQAENRPDRPKEIPQLKAIQKENEALIQTREMKPAFQIVNEASTNILGETWPSGKRWQKKSI